MTENVVRQHLNRDGQPKRAWPTYGQAKRWADALHVVKPRVGRLDPYRCDLCGEWHVGNPISRKGVLRIELGQRAFIALTQENQRKESRRRFFVHRRARRAEALRNERRAA